ncbi:MAG: NAD(P)-dependent oxidoreductase [Bacteroidales bacterium]|nr:NAD(P)-dependent oxidoreductase [Lachnoclostridium sp.]MCM1383932.1 NAD(P)-dependent oxidoreductase [Lachnoclostridium sp.]MCM1464641.1 NAD(P)-dependent oxidoreductase [Bacteroidales bacterium]
MTVLITGIGGFVGKNAAKYLIDNGIEVIGVYHKKAPECTIRKCFSCDLAGEDIEQYIGSDKIDAVIHFAGQMRGDKVRDYLDNTIKSTRRLIDYAEKAKIRQFIYISSISAYGETLSSVNENSDRINLDDYGMSKYLCERLLEDAAIEKRMVLRLPRILGKNCDLSYPWLPKAAQQMLKDETIYYTNPDLLYNNMLYMDDLSKFLLILLDKDMKGFERFVLGAKGRMRIIDILETLKKEISSKSELIEKRVNNRNKCYAIDTAHAEAYGFKSRSIDEILRTFAQDIRIEQE